MLVAALIFLGFQSKAQNPPTQVDLHVLEIARDGVRQGSLQAIQEAADLGWHPNQRFSDGSTAIGLAAWNGNLEIVEFLIEKGASLDEEKNSVTPLRWAIMGAQSHLLSATGEPEEHPIHNRIVPEVLRRLKLAHYLLDRGAKISSAAVQQSCSLYWHVASRTPQTLAYGLRTGLRSEVEGLIARLFHGAPSLSVDDLNAAIVCGSSLAAGIVLKRVPKVVNEKIFGETEPLVVALLNMPAGGPELSTIAGILVGGGASVEAPVTPGDSEFLNPPGRTMSVLAYVAADAAGPEGVEWLLRRGIRPGQEDLEIVKAAQERCVEYVKDRPVEGNPFAAHPCAAFRNAARKKIIERLASFF